VAESGQDPVDPAKGRPGQDAVAVSAAGMGSRAGTWRISATDGCRGNRAITRRAAGRRSASFAGRAEVPEAGAHISSGGRSAIIVA